MLIKSPEPLPPSVSPELRVNCARFVESLKGSKDGVYERLLKINHGSQTKTVGDWRALLETYRTQPVERPASARVQKIR